jgi:hypothetical protein
VQMSDPSSQPTCRQDVPDDVDGGSGLVNLQAAVDFSPLLGSLEVL